MLPWGFPAGAAASLVLCRARRRDIYYTIRAHLSTVFFKFGEKSAQFLRRMRCRRAFFLPEPRFFRAWQNMESAGSTLPALSRMLWRHRTSCFRFIARRRIVRFFLLASRTQSRASGACASFSRGISRPWNPPRPPWLPLRGPVWQFPLPSIQRARLHTSYPARRLR